MHRTRLRTLALVGTLLFIFSSYRPVMGVMENHQVNVSGVVNTFHGDQQMGTLLPVDCCINCHPYAQSATFNKMMGSAAIDCTSCHGQMTEFRDTTSSTQASLPGCRSCHVQSLTAPVKIIQNDEMITAEGKARNQIGKPDDHRLSRLTPGRSDVEKVCDACHINNYEAAFWHFRMKQ